MIQILWSLISNAIKHNDNPQGKIRITARECETNKEWVEIFVANGPGIPMQYREKVFQVFQTLQARDKTGNTGVGLSIVKKLSRSKVEKLKYWTWILSVQLLKFFGPIKPHEFACGSLKTI